jgi:hypothetical protein
MKLMMKMTSKWLSKAVKHTMDAPGERNYSSYSLMTSALDGVSGSVTPRLCFTPGERAPGTHWTAGWVGPSANLDRDARGKILCLC